MGLQASWVVVVVVGGRMVQVGGKGQARIPLEFWRTKEEEEEVAYRVVRVQREGPSVGHLQPCQLPGSSLGSQWHLPHRVSLKTRRNRLRKVHFTRERRRCSPTAATGRSCAPIYLDHREGC